MKKGKNVAGCVFLNPSKLSTEILVFLGHASQFGPEANYPGNG
jgi:hypothetical protein